MTGVEKCYTAPLQPHASTLRKFQKLFWHRLLNMALIVIKAAQDEKQYPCFLSLRGT